MKVYDCFLFFNELDLLKIRLELLYDHVDYFVISECDSTFSGLKKVFNFEINRDLFKKYEDKIIYVKHYNSDIIDNLSNTHTGKKHDVFNKIISNYNIIKNSPETDFGKAHWCRDFLHREFVEIGMSECEDNDIIIFSDLDEIPNPDKFKLDGESYVMNQKNMIYYINRENITEKWYGSFITRYSNIKHSSLGKIRRSRVNNFKIIENAGWHLTFMGGEDRISEKLKSYSHQEYNNDHIHSQIGNKLINNTDILNRGIKISNINIDEYYPETMINLIKDKFNYLINENY